MTDKTHPDYYAKGAPALEPLELTIMLPHPLAAAFEYVYRAGSKPGVPAIEDLRKAEVWLEAGIDRMDAGLLFPKPHAAIFLMMRIFAKKSDFANVLLERMARTRNREPDYFWGNVFNDALDYVRTRIDEEEEQALKKN